MSLSPIILFVYNRPLHTLKTLKSLKENELADQSELFIYCDGPKEKSTDEELEALEEVRRIIRNEKWCKTVNIIESDKNKGLAKSVIHGVTETINFYGSAIVLEDDMVTSKYFLRFMDEALDFYKNEEKVISITGYLFPVKPKTPETFFLKGTYCWGWATWKRGWEIFNPDGGTLLSQIENRNLSFEFDFFGTHHYTRMLREQAEKKNDSWALPWYASAFLQDKLTLLPGRSLVKNIGLDATGTHGDETNMWDVVLSDKPIVINEISIEEDLPSKKAVADFFKSIKPKFSIINRAKVRSKRMIKKMFGLHFI